MIEHIVIIKFDENTLQEQLLEACDRFKALKGKIPGILEADAGINFSDNNKGFQVLLRSRFENKKALEDYGPHSEHRAVASFIREIGRVDSIVLDIEV
jgi:hypothetical protein